MRTSMSAFMLMAMSTFLLSFSLTCTASDFERSVVRLKTEAAAHNSMRPWQMEASESRSGQAVAVGKSELVAIASQLRDHQLIQVQTATESHLIEARVKAIDYDLDLCLLSVDPKELSEDFIPVTFKISIKIEDPIQFVWLTEDQRFLKTQGRLEHADTFFSSRTQTGFLQFIASSESFPGGFTEPIFQDNKFIGLVQSLDSDKKTSTMIPTSLILSFLKRARETSYMPSPKAGFSFVPLPDLITRSYLKLPSTEKRGVYIQDVYDFGTGSLEFKIHDVLLKWGAFDVDSKGAVMQGRFGKTALWSLLGEASVGTVVPCLIWRNGALLEIPVSLKTFSSEGLPIPYDYTDSEPPYYITGGYLFQEFSFPYLDAFGSNWESRMNPLLKQLSDKYRFHKVPGKDRIVIMTQTLPHPINQGYQHLHHKIVAKVNSAPVKTLKDLQALFSITPMDGFFQIELEEHSPDIVIPANDLNNVNHQIQKLYSVPQLSHFDPEAEKPEAKKK